jgi:hypothetical protein
MRLTWDSITLLREASCRRNAQRSVDNAGSQKRNTLRQDAVYYSILIKHYPATLGLPVTSLAALALVFLLEYTKGPIEFQGLGFRFKGAAGPLVFWIACFLVMNLSISTLWSREFHSPIADRALDALVSDQIQSGRIERATRHCVEEAKLRGQTGDDPEVKKRCAERLELLMKSNCPSSDGTRPSGEPAQGANSRNSS